MVCKNVLADAPRALTMLGRESDAGPHQALLKVIVQFPTVMMKQCYTDELEIIEDHRAGKSLWTSEAVRLNKCGAISPRFDVRLKDWEKWQNNLLLSHQSGFIVLTTSGGIMNKEARQNTQEGKSGGSFSRDVKHGNKKPPWTVKIKIKILRIHSDLRSYIWDHV